MKSRKMLKTGPNLPFAELKPTLPYEHRYFASYPIEDASDALWFSKEVTHSVLDLLWKAGPRGLTPLELIDFLQAKHRTTGRSIIYQTLRGLYEEGIVDREWDNSTKAHRHILRGESMPVILDPEYEDWLDDNFGDMMERVLFPAFLKCVDEVMKMLREGKVPGKFAPANGKSSWCGKCGYSHQADDFFMSLLFFASMSFVNPADWEFKNKELPEALEKLYDDNQLADPKRDKAFAKSE